MPAPLNVLFTPGTRRSPRLAELGVARISTGSLLFRAALGARVDDRPAIRDGATRRATRVTRPSTASRERAASRANPASSPRSRTSDALAGVDVLDLTHDLALGEPLGKEPDDQRDQHAHTFAPTRPMDVQRPQGRP